MKESAIDYSVHGKFVESTPEALADIEKMAEGGIPTFKMFMTYKKEGVMSDDETMLKVFEKAKEVNGLPMVHCESNAIAESNIEKCREANDMSWVNFAKCKPVLCEAEAFARAVYFAEYVGRTILLTGSDDCTFDVDEKSAFLEKNEDGTWKQDFTKVVNGISGIEIRLPLLLSEGVSKGRISINKVCELTSTNIAKIYGCYPQKGIIAPGSDADIVLVDMEKEVTLSKDVLHNNISYCLHDGFQVKGYPVMTISKGKVIVENGEFKGQQGSGDFIKRKINPEYLKKYGLN